jgi:hypothetical protein
MNHFSYHSEQIHSHNGHTRKNTVDIKDGKGVKRVETYNDKGKLKTRKEKKLNRHELECIKRNEFIPGLFKDCIKGGVRSGVRQKRKTMRQRAK